MIDSFRQTWSNWERLASRRLLAHSIPLDGLTRTALLYVPRHMLDRGPLPLVVMLHGGASSPEAIASTSAMHRIAEREGFIVAYPRGTKGRSGLTWNPAGNEAARKAGDARFVRELIIDLRQRYRIDPARIYTAGFSIGGSLVYEIASVLAHRIAAAAVVSGTMIADGYIPAQPVPLIHIHGTKDRRVPLEGGHGPSTSRSKAWPPVRQGIDRWCRINGCTGEPQVVRLGIKGVTGYRYSGAADVELWLVEGGRHGWPGGKRDEAHPDQFSASEAIWSFFAGHPGARASMIPAAGGAPRPEARVRRPAWP